MDATRFRVGAVLEWLLAAAGVIALLAAGSLVVHQVRTVSAVTPVIAREVPASVVGAPASVPPGAISLPMLLFPDGKGVRLGETWSEVTARIGKGIGAPVAERVPNGERVVTRHEYAGTLFQLVFEPLARDEEPRLAAIYR